GRLPVRALLQCLQLLPWPIGVMTMKGSDRFLRRPSSPGYRLPLAVIASCFSGCSSLRVDCRLHHLDVMASRHRVLFGLGPADGWGPSLETRPLCTSGCCLDSWSASSGQSSARLGFVSFQRLAR